MFGMASPSSSGVGRSPEGVDTTQATDLLHLKHYEPMQPIRGPPKRARDVVTFAAIAVTSRVGYPILGLAGPL